MYKFLFCVVLFFVTSYASAQQVKLSMNLIGQAWLESDNGYKSAAVVDRGLFLEYEKELKVYSWSYNAVIGYSRIVYNRRVETFMSDTYNQGYILHFRPIGVKKYFRTGRWSNYYLELMAGIDYLAKLSKKPERTDLAEENLNNMGFSVGASAKTGFKIEFNGGRNAFDVGFNSTVDVYSRMHIDKINNENFKVERVAVYLTFYKSLKKNEKVPRIPFTDN